MADENNAQFGVEIPPVKGIQEAIKDFDKLTESVKRLGSAVEGLGNRLQNIKPGGGGGAAGDLQKMQGAASQLLMTMGPLGQQAALLQQRFSGMGAAIGGLGSLSAGAVIGIGLAVVALLALAAAAVAVKKAFDVMMESIRVASKFQGLSDTFSDFIGDAKAAQVEMAKMQALWHRAGVFKLDELVEAGTRIRSLGGGIEHITELTEAMAKASKAGTGDIKGMTEAFGSLMAGRIRGAPSLDQLTLIRAIAVQSKGPMESLDQAVARTTLSIKKHEIATEDMARALIKAGQAGGIFEHEIEEEQNMFEGASKVMSQRWEEFMLALGTPIIDALTPIMLRWAHTLDQLIPKGKEWGTNIGTMITKIDAAVGALDNMIARLERIPGLLEAMKAVMRTIPLIGPVLSAGTTAAQITHNLMTPPAPTNPPPVEAGAMDTPYKVPGAGPGKLGDWIKTHEAKAGGGGESEWEKYKSDLKLLSDYWEEYTIIQGKATTATEAQWRQMQAIDKIIPTLGDPLAHMAELMKGLGPDDAALVRWKVLNEVATRTLKNIEDKAKANQATMAQVWQAGLKKMTDAWGSFQEQMINGIGEIGNALVSDISGGLADILDGTKSVKDGFRDMALSIVKDIERIVLKMLVQLAIQQLISAFGGGAGSVSMGSSGTGWYSGQAGFAAGPVTQGVAVTGQEGGAVPGQGRGDHVHALLEPGEFVIPRDSAERIGYGQLEKMRKMADGGRVQRMAEGGFITGAIGPNSEFHAGQVVFIPGIGEVHLTDYGPGVTGIDIPVNNRHQMFSGLVNRDVMVNGVMTHLSGYIPNDPKNDPKGGGSLDAFGHRIIRLGASGTGGRRAGGIPNPFTGRHRQGSPGDPGGESPTDRLGFRDPDFPGGFNVGPSGYGPGGLPPFAGSGGRPGFPGDLIAPGQVVVPTEYRGPGGYTTAPGAFTGEAPGMFLAPSGMVFAPAPGGKYQIISGPGQGSIVNNIPTGSTAIRGLTSSTPGGGGGQPIFYDPRGGMGGAPDYSRGADPYSPGAYNPAGPGLGPGHFGTGFGSGTVGNFYTAIGFDQLGRGGGPVNLSQWGTNYSRHWAAQQMKGIIMTRQNFGLLKHAMPSMTGGPGGLGGSYENYAKNQQYWQGVFQARGYVFGTPPQLGYQQQQHHGHLPMQSHFHEGGLVRRYHEGGVVDAVAEYQSGGTVRRGEGVFTPEQMASLSPAGGGTQVNQITIAINNQGGRTDARAEGSGLNDKDAREMARAMLAVCKAQIEKEKRSGGSLYLSRSQRGG